MLLQVSIWHPDKYNLNTSEKKYVFNPKKKAEQYYCCNFWYCCILCSLSFHKICPLISWSVFTWDFLFADSRLFQGHCKLKSKLVYYHWQNGRFVIEQEPCYGHPLRTWWNVFICHLLSSGPLLSVTGWLFNMIGCILHILLFSYCIISTLNLE